MEIKTCESMLDHWENQTTNLRKKIKGHSGSLTNVPILIQRCISVQKKKISYNVPKMYLFDNNFMKYTLYINYILNYFF